MKYSEVQKEVWTLVKELSDTNQKLEKLRVKLWDNTATTPLAQKVMEAHAKVLTAVDMLVFSVDLSTDEIATLHRLGKCIEDNYYCPGAAKRKPAEWRKNMEMRCICLAERGLVERLATKFRLTPLGRRHIEYIQKGTE